MKITFDNRSNSKDSINEVGGKILQTLIENGIYEDIQIDVTHDDSGTVWRHEIICTSVTTHETLQK